MAAAAIPLVAIIEEPMLSRLDRLDTIVKQLEEIRGGRLSLNRSSSPAKSSFESTNSRGTLTSSDGGHDDPPSSVDFSPRSLEKHCRPIDDVLMETELKGNVLERLAHVEDRVMKICEDLEKELMVGIDQIKGSSREEVLPEISSPTTPTEKKGSKKKGLKQLVKSCVKGKHKSRQEPTASLVS